MKETDKDNTEEQNDQSSEKPDFIREFIEHKRLQNRVLQEIIDKIIQGDHGNETEKTNDNEKQ